MGEEGSNSQLQQVHHSERVSGPFLLVRLAMLAHGHCQCYWEISRGMCLRTEEGQGTCVGVTYWDRVGLVLVLLCVGFQVINVYGEQP